MRILHVLHSHGYGGAESHVIILMRGQIAQGHEVMFAGPLDSWLGKACQEHGIPATHLRMTGLYDIGSHLRLLRLVKTWGADIIHGHLVRASYYAGWAGRLSGTVAISTAHTTNALKHMDRCDHIIADSKANETNLLAYGHPQDKLSVIYTGVPDAPRHDCQAIRQELGIPEDTFAVVHAGRFIRDKGQDVLVRALAEVSDPKVRLYLIGADDTDYAAQVHQLPQTPGRVTYLGFRSDVQRILQGFDLYVQPSRREGLPLAVSEAFVARLPVIATRVGGMPEVVLHEQTGLVVTPDTPTEMGQAITRLAADRAFARQLAENGRRFYDQHLTEHTMVNRALDVYRGHLSALALAH
ncbi:MAG TPA: glycosyltransferase family 4 protein [Candidatus Aquabacterium excrementipullorum]|nr:glycosyltransferase family 4 protein [Candidatus Aquabacterium excrementipullorum]